MLTTFSSGSQSSRVFIMSSTKHIELHARSKPTFTIACTIIIVIMYEMPNRTLQVLNPIKTNDRNRIFNRRAKLQHLTLLFKLLLSVSLSNSLLLAPPSKLCSRTFLIFSANEVFVSARSLDCALFCCKARMKRLEHERSVGGNTKHSRVFLPTSWVLYQSTVKASLFVL